MTIPRRDKTGKAILEPLISYIYLLGIIHGHYDMPIPEIDQIIGSESSVNVGIAIVIPFEKVMEIINMPKLVQERERIMEENRIIKSVPDNIDND